MTTIKRNAILYAPDAARLLIILTSVHTAQKALKQIIRLRKSCRDPSFRKIPNERLRRTGVFASMLMHPTLYHSPDCLTYFRAVSSIVNTSVSPIVWSLIPSANVPSTVASAVTLICSFAESQGVSAWWARTHLPNTYSTVNYRTPKIAPIIGGQ